MDRSREELSESLVSRLRNRKRRIVTYSIGVVLFLVVLAIQCVKLSMMWSFLAPREGDDLLLHVALGQPMVVWMATVSAATLVFALIFTGIAMKLVNEIFGVTRDDLLVQLWDRLQVLERSQATRSNFQQQDRPCAEGPLGGQPETPWFGTNAPQPQSGSPLGGPGPEKVVE